MYDEIECCPVSMMPGRLMRNLIFGLDREGSRRMITVAIVLGLTVIPDALRMPPSFCDHGDGRDCRATGALILKGIPSSLIRIVRVYVVVDGEYRTKRSKRRKTPWVYD